MKKAIILHGMPDKEECYNPAGIPSSQKHWFSWLQHQLLLRDILTQTPEFPKPYAPNYKAWKEVFEQFVLDEETILVGHSCGAGFLVRWLSENPRAVKKVVLVAPWINPDKIDQELVTDFFDFAIDVDLPKRIEKITIITSDNDDADILKSVELLKAAWPTCHVVSLSGMGHFTLSDMGTVEFPQLLDTILA